MGRLWIFQAVIAPGCGGGVGVGEEIARGGGAEVLCGESAAEGIAQGKGDVGQAQSGGVGQVSQFCLH